ncbi:MAG: hypothetical protein H6841_08510 [Planctomycetes bacterium]|nr:hypothetical protein [Planctomycetota bacterium]MCB9934801.1 hypothetical protein [Planctomycetota bacterium]
MARLVVLIALATLASAAQAQVFPRIEKEDVKQRIATGAPQSEEKPEPAVEDKPSEVDGARALRRYREILEGFEKDERGQKKAMTRHTEELHESVRDYLEGVFMLRLGMYKEADRKLKDVGHAVRREGEIKTPELLNIAEEVRSGKAYYYRMMAVILREYESFKSEADAEAAWKKAADEGGKVKRELEKLVDSGKVSGEKDVLRDMTAWLLTAKREWLNLYKAEQNIAEHPENLNSWTFLVANTGSKQNELQKEYTPNYLKQRAAIQVIQEFWPTSPYNSGGVADVTLALNHIGCGQLEGWETYLESKDYHTLAGKLVLKKARDNAKTYIDIIEALKNK